MTAGFPSFIEWLAGHTDEALTAIRPTALHDVTDVASLRAIDLLLLHAATELDATVQPVTVGEVVETAEELLNIAGTPSALRPRRIDLDATFHKLASHGFIYGPHWELSPGKTTTVEAPEVSDPWELKIAPTVASYFDPATSEAWALADHHRCPLPTEDLGAVVEELPARQRRLLQTLHASGGVGHSASVGPDGNPEAPLPTMVRRGLLDQLDDTTVRLTGRVAQYLEGIVIAEPGGDFLTTDCPHYQRPQSTESAEYATQDDATGQSSPAAHSSAARQQSATAVSNAVQTILELTELLLDISQHPIEPLTNGGIGLRSLGKTAKRLRISEDELTARLTLAIETGLVATGYLTEHAEEFPSPYWGITSAGQDFLRNELADQWTQLLLAWSRSSYAPWEAHRLEAREFEPQLFLLTATRTRQCFPFCFSTPTANRSPDSSGPARIQQTMWRVNPAVATTASPQLWDVLFSEARSLGLVVDHEATTSLFALANALTNPSNTDPDESFAKLRAQLTKLLPAPVKYLIIQSDHTIMAPGLLSPADAARLRSIAVQESSGIASVWRVTTEAVLRAYADGVTRAELEEFLSTMTPGGWSAVPQSLQYTIADAERLYQNSAESPVPLLQKTPNYTVGTITNPEPGEDGDVFWDGEWETIISAVENQRQLTSEDSGAGGASKNKEANQPTRLHELTEIKQALRQAMKTERLITVRYVNTDSEPVEAEVEIVMTEPARVVGVAKGDRGSIHIPISHIEWVQPIEPS